MLVLSRREQEAIRIGEDILVTVPLIRGKLVRLGIQAPANVLVDREEVHQRKRQWEVPQTVPPIDIDLTREGA